VRPNITFFEISAKKGNFGKKMKKGKMMNFKKIRKKR
jgi:hypothetical protein